MTPKAARNLSAVAFVALLRPSKNLLWMLDDLFGSPTPWERLTSAALLVFGPEGIIWGQILPWILLAFFLSLALYRYLRRRDFSQLCTDCAARKPLVWVLFLLFAFFSIVQPTLVRICPPPDYTAYSGEDFVCYDESFDAPEDAPPTLQPDTQNSELKTQNSPEVPQ